MSVAFTKEDSAETASEILLPDRAVSPHPNLVTEAGLRALELQLHQAREAFETAQKIEDVNERRRQAAIPLRDARYFAARVRSAHARAKGCLAGIPEGVRRQAPPELDCALPPKRPQNWTALCHLRNDRYDQPGQQAFNNKVHHVWPAAFAKS